MTLATALTDFLEFLESFNCPIIVGHNVENFDVPVLYNSLQQLNMVSAFKVAISGFVDTLKAAKLKIAKDELPGDKKSYKQEVLVKTFIGTDYEAHNALGDVKALQSLYYAKIKLSVLELSSSLFPLQLCAYSRTLKVLVDKKVISSAMKSKLAHSNLGLKELKLAHKRDPREGIDAIFSEPLGIRMIPRITKSKKIIQRVVEYLSKIAE